MTRTRISVKSLLNGKIFVFPIDEPNRIVSRVPLPPEGVNDMITMSDLSEASILWNIKVRYDHRQFYVGINYLKTKTIDIFFFFSKFLDVYWQYSHCCQSILYVS